MLGFDVRAALGGVKCTLNTGRGGPVCLLRNNALSTFVLTRTSSLRGTAVAEADCFLVGPILFLKALLDGPPCEIPIRKNPLLVRNVEAVGLGP